MATTVIGATALEVDAEGFLQKPEQWTEEIGIEIARAAGIDDLPTGRVPEFLRRLDDAFPG